jgi:ABC-2 type transport system ATP-binding protein
MKLTLDRISKRFGKLAALDAVSFELDAGRALALIGPNGSGKSTLIRIVLGLLSSQGRVLFDGEPRTAQTADRIAYVPQIAPKLAAPCAELVRTVTRVRGIPNQEIERVAEALRLDLGAIGRMPFQNLSGGTKQKLLLVLALASSASLYVLDEPTASLDAEARADFFRLFAERAGGATLILCSHRVEELSHLVDRVVALSDGRVAHEGPAKSYLSARGQSLIELSLVDRKLDAWLRQRGFEQHAGSSWQKSVTRQEKLGLLHELTTRLNGQLENIQIRDLEQVELDPARKEIDA